MPPLLQIKVVSFAFLPSHLPRSGMFLLVSVFPSVSVVCLLFAHHGPMLLAHFICSPQCTASPLYYYYILFIYFFGHECGWVSATTPQHMCGGQTDLGGWFSPSNHVLGNKLRSVTFVSAELAPIAFITHSGKEACQQEMV